jgi:thiol-disulfide isomerase/thioredoxin
MLVSRLMIAIGLACLVTPLALAQGALGSAAPPIEIEYLLQSPEGSKATLESLRGKVIVIDFWATWCMPCIRTMPHLNDLAKEFKDEPVQFIAVTKEPPSKIESFLTKHEIAAWVGIDANGSMFRDYRITGIPNTYIIDREGKIAARLHPRR